MNEHYAEWSVKAKRAPYAIPLLIAMTLGLAAGFVLMIAFSWGFFVFAAVCGGCFVGYRFLKVEYEYIFVTNELRFDRIYRSTWRRHALTLQMSEIDAAELLPAGQPRKVNGIKTVDMSSGDLAKDVYVISFSDKGGRKRLLFEPNEKILFEMWNAAPRTVRVPERVKNFQR